MYVYCRKLSAVTYILASILLMFVVTFKCLNSHLGRCLETSTLEVGWNPQFLSGDKLVVWVKQFPLLCHTGFNCGSRSLTFITATGLHRLKLWFDVNPLHHWATQSSIVVWGQPTSPLGHTSFKCGLRPTHFTTRPHKFQMWFEANPLHHWATQVSNMVWGQPTSPLGHTSFKCGLRPTHFTTGPHKFQMWFEANPLHHWATQVSNVVWGQSTSPLGHTNFICGLRPTHFTTRPYKFQMWFEANPLHH
jgi:hypothetical protein